MLNNGCVSARRGKRYVSVRVSVFLFVLCASKKESRRCRIENIWVKR